MLSLPVDFVHVLVTMLFTKVTHLKEGVGTLQQDPLWRAFHCVTLYAL